MACDSINNLACTFPSHLHLCPEGWHYFLEGASSSEALSSHLEISAMALVCFKAKGQRV